MSVVPLKAESKAVKPAPAAKPRTKPPAAPILGDDARVVGLDLGDHVRKLMEVFGSPNPHFALEMLDQLANIASDGPEFDKCKTNFALCVVAGIEPRDQIEAMLAAQMAAVHMATMKFSRRLSHAATILQQDADEKAFNKLARTFTAQVEALKRYRSKGEQRVYVERVNVEQGGQAIVGNVQHGGSEKNGG